MKIRYYHRLLTLLSVLLVMLLAACSDDVASDEQAPLPEGMGRIRITICTPEANPDFTRAVNATPWEDPDHEWERLQTFRILICDGNNNVVKIIEGDKNQMAAVSGTSYPYKQSADITTEITAGTYKIYATANYADGYTVGSTVIPEATVRFPNGYSATGTTEFGDANPIPMTGKLASAVTVNDGETKDAGTITVWRVMAKMQFYFTNEASEQILIMGVEVDPINTNSDNQGLVYLFSKDDLTSTANLPASGTGTVTLPASGVTTGPVSHETSTTTPLLTLDAYSGTGEKPKGNIFFYVNETNATFTTTLNQYSLRFKIKRGGTISELRYGVTTHYGNGSIGQDGFNVIRRNDWIHIPIILTDWHYRIEPLPFVPIGGYPAATVSSDGLTATFSTGGMIALQPFIKKKDDATWRDFGDSDISYGDDSWVASIHWKNSDGTDVSGDDYIVKTAFAYDPDSKYIIGELNQAKVGSNAKTTFTVHLKLKGPKVSEDPETYVWYDYTFTFNIVLQ